MIKFRNTAALLALGMAIAGAVAISAGSAQAQQQHQQMRDDIEQFAMDLHVGMQRSSLTEQQKEQVRKDLKDLREARQNHDRIAGFRAIRNLRSIIDSGAFKPEDKERIKQDLQQIREAREDSSGPM